MSAHFLFWNEGEKTNVVGNGMGRVQLAKWERQ